MAVGDAVFQVFQAFQTSISTFKCHMDVAKVDIECFICCNDNIRMFQAYVQSISVVSDTCFKCFHLDVAYIAMAAHACFKYLFSCVSDVSNLLQKWIWMSHMLLWLYKHVSRTCLNYFSYMLQMFHIYVLKVDQVLHML